MSNQLLPKKKLINQYIIIHVAIMENCNMKHDYTMQISVLDLEKTPVKIILEICLVLYVRKILQNYAIATI
jgi:hypothetical protein